MESEKLVVEYMKPKEIMTYIVDKLHKIYISHLLKISDNSYDEFIQNLEEIILDREYLNKLEYSSNKIIIVVKYYYFDPYPLKDKEYEIYNNNGFTNGQILYEFSNILSTQRIKTIDNFYNSYYFAGLELNDNGKYDVIFKSVGK